MSTQSLHRGRGRPWFWKGHRLSVFAVAVGACLCVAPRAAGARGVDEAALAKIGFEQKLNAQVSLDLPFWDEQNNPVTLRRYSGQKPLILVLGYYRCPMLCTLIDNGLIESLEDLKWSIGREFTVVHVSIDPHETPDLALAKKATCLKRYGRTDASAGWHFLTGEQAAIQTLANEVGFDYLYDPSTGQYAHASGLVVLTPEGKVSRYLFGVTFPPMELFQALAAASNHQVGSPIQRLILLCFHYNPITGKYGRVIMAAVRGLSILTVLGLGWLILRVSSGKSGGQGPRPAASEASQAPVKSAAGPAPRSPVITRALRADPLPPERSAVAGTTNGQTVELASGGNSGHRRFPGP